MEERSGKEIRVYVSNTVYTTIKQKSVKLGVTMSALCRAYILYALDNKVYLFND